MKPSQPWHDSPIGSTICWLGGIRFAVPILVLVAVALAVGTYIESTSSGKAARAAVYGSWWFITLMGLMCLSLIFAVVTRYPWKRRHVGFIIVHASLVTLIIAGFWSLFGRVEGRLALQQGMSAAEIEMEEESLELVEHDAGTFKVLGSIPAPRRPGEYTIAGTTIHLASRWANTREEFEVNDRNPMAFRAVEVSLTPGAVSGTWIGEDTGSGPGLIAGLTIIVLPPATAWTPPPPPQDQEKPGFYFTVGGTRFPLVPEGQEVFPGWTIQSVRSFSQAKVSASGLSNSDSGDSNPAVEVVIADGKGTTERHTAFANFPDMIMLKTVQGQAKSSATLSPSRNNAPVRESLVLHGAQDALRADYIAPDGAVITAQRSGGFPWSFRCGDRSVTIFRDFLHAQETSRFVEAPAAAEQRPSLLVGASGGADPAPLAWKSILPVPTPGRTVILRYGPRTVKLPFSVKLDEFRKTDYPGIDMAMSYESSVTYSIHDQAERRTTISMNNPLVASGWKVFQSGFMGQDVSIFSVMRDPGLVLTYIACTLLCIGILITFYGRGLTWGHPGIPTPFASKENAHVPVPLRGPDSAVVVRPVADDGGPADQGVDVPAGRAADPGRRTRDAAGYVRA